MKKHNNTFKRVAASAVSMLTVAGMMPANVGGFLTQSSSLVAYAINEQVSQKATFTGIKNTINSVKINNVTYNNYGEYNWSQKRAKGTRANLQFE